MKNELRAHIRYDFHKEIEYLINQGKTDKTFKGIIINISEGGLCLYVYNPLNKGQDIIIKSDMRDLNRKVNVRWCNELGENVYKAGLMFVN